MSSLLAILAVTVATRTPVVKTPTPAAQIIMSGAQAMPARPLTLQELARERKKKDAPPKGGSISTYGTTVDGTKSAADPKAGDEASQPASSDPPGAANIRVTSVVLQSLASNGRLSFSGHVLNTGNATGCRVLLGIQAIDDTAQTVGSVQVILTEPVPPSQEQSFSGSLEVPPSSLTQAEAGLGNGGAGRIAIEQGGRIITGVRGSLVSLERCRK